MYRSSPFRGSVKKCHFTRTVSSPLAKTCQFHGAVNTSSAKTTQGILCFFLWRCCLHQDLNDLKKSSQVPSWWDLWLGGALLFQSWFPPPEHHFTPHLEAINFGHEWKGGRDSTRPLGDYHQRSSHGYLGGGFKFNFWNFHPENWRRCPIWRIFFRWVGSTTN